MGEKNTSIKLHIAGDGAAGKACLATSFAESSVPHNHNPTGKIVIDANESRSAIFIK